MSPETFWLRDQGRESSGSSSGRATSARTTPLDWRKRVSKSQSGRTHALAPSATERTPAVPGHFGFRRIVSCKNTTEFYVVTTLRTPRARRRTARTSTTFG